MSKKPKEITEAQFREIVGMAIGQASVAWSELPSGEFDSTKGAELVERIVEAAKNLKTKVVYAW